MSTVTSYGARASRVEHVPSGRPLAAGPSAGRALLAEVRDADPALSGWFDEVEEYLRRQG